MLHVLTLQMEKRLAADVLLSGELKRQGESEAIVVEQYDDIIVVSTVSLESGKVRRNGHDWGTGNIEAARNAVKYRAAGYRQAPLVLEIDLRVATPDWLCKTDVAAAVKDEGPACASANRGLSFDGAH